MKAKIYYKNKHGLGILKGTLENLKLGDVETDDKDSIASRILWSYVCGQNRTTAGRPMTSGDYIEFKDGEIWVCCVQKHKATDRDPAHESVTWDVLK